MCLQHSAVRPYQKWTWAGNEIVQDTALPVRRTLKSKRGTIHSYQADIREFLSIEKNAVIRAEVKKMIARLSPDDQQHFYTSDPGNRDDRVRHCQDHLRRFEYCPSKKGYDDWQYPEETIVLKSGDCEDFAFLLAAMLEACDISPYCLRVAFGKVMDYSTPSTICWDHAWVMYQNEHGAWELIEPVLHLLKTSVSTAPLKLRPAQLTDVEYIPHYVFNRDHLWNVRSDDPVTRERFYKYVRDSRDYTKKFHPAFAAQVHNSIFDEALKGVSWINRMRIKAVSLYVDANTICYDPRDHFDFGYVSESWERVTERLQSDRLTDFALAAHGIADFYAHSFYGYFAMTGAGTIPVYDPSNPAALPNLSYDFSRLGELPGCESDVASASKYWTDKQELISGQWFRWYASIPNALQHKPDFKIRRCLPDHDAVAVDSPKYAVGKHLLFNEPDYGKQFDARKAAAIKHVRMAYKGGEYGF